MADEQPRGAGRFIWKIETPESSVAIMHIKMDKETATQFSIALYKMLSDPERDDVTFDFTLEGFIAQWEKKGMKSNLVQTSDKRH